MSKRSRESDVKLEAEIARNKTSKETKDNENSENVFVEQIYKISGCFSVLETVLVSFKTRSMTPKWCDVHDACEAMNSSNVTLAEICNIMQVFPDAYKFTWQQTGQFSTASKTNDIFELVIALNLVGTSKNVLPQMSSRRKQFDILVAEALAKDPNCLDEPDYNLIPQKPEVVKHKHMQKGPLLPAFADISDLHFKSNDSKNTPANNECNSFESLRQKIAAREESLKERAVVVHADNTERDRVKQLKFLLVVADALRAILVSENRASLSLVEAAQKIISSTKYKTREAKTAISTLSEVVPEFVTMIPSNEVLNVVSVRVNADCVYGEVRKRLLGHIRDNCGVNQ